MSPLGPAGSVALMRALRQNWIRTGSRKQAPRGLAVLLMCGLFFVVAKMMEEGRRLAEENREFV